MKRLKVGLNGFGRIGRAFTRIALMRDTFDIVAINTRKTPIETMAYQLEYDSVYRHFPEEVHVHDHILIVGNRHIATTQVPEPENIPWDQYKVDVVVDATGAFKTREDLSRHIKGSVKKVILTAPAKDDMPHVVLGVNDNNIDWHGQNVFSNASCTTNCAAPLFKVLNDRFHVISGLLSTVHAYTASQSLVDDANKTFSTSRAAATNIIPSTTGAAKAVAKTIPDLMGKIDGMALRVPVPVGSFTDVTALVEKSTTVEEVNAAFKAASENELKTILGYESKVLVSSDYIGDSRSSIFDANYTKVMNGNFIKVCGWYDNEWGYSTRLTDLVNRLGTVIE
jgi:glyceraldehyde 3-phosphate dehydrogenase